MCKYNELCNGCYFKETVVESDKYAECWDCVPVMHLDDTSLTKPSNYVEHLPYYE